MFSIGLKARGYVHSLIGASLYKFHRVLFELSDKGFNVLLTGERGTGKELAATFYAQESFSVLLPMNCAASTTSLLESKLFGHKKGAYSGAERDRIGLVGQVEKIRREKENKKKKGDGVIFFDEIGDASEEF